MVIQYMFDFEAGQILANTGMNLAVETADAEFPKWSERCWQLFQEWVSEKEIGFEFQVEDFRKHLYENELIERPRSERAFGFLTGKAVKSGLIKYAGTAKVDNKKAHACFAATWVKVISMLLKSK